MTSQAVNRRGTEPTDEAGPLGDLLCFDLYSAHRAITGVYRQILEPLGLTYPQYLVLTVLWSRGEASVGEIIADVDLDYGTVSPLLKRMEQRGLVERRRRTDDERSVAITLTDAGRALQGRCVDFPAVLDAAFGLRPDTLSKLRRMLETVRASADAEEARLAAGATSPASAD
jgi:DNA-binding MarR family transcriptional regulator